MNIIERHYINKKSSYLLSELSYLKYEAGGCLTSSLILKVRTEVNLTSCDHYPQIGHSFSNSILRFRIAVKTSKVRRVNSVLDKVPLLSVSKSLRKLSSNSSLYSGTLSSLNCSWSIT